MLTPFFDAHEQAVVAGIVRMTPGALGHARRSAALLGANAIVLGAGTPAHPLGHPRWTRSGSEV